MEFFCGYIDVEISAIWQKFLRYRYILPNLIWSEITPRIRIKQRNLDICDIYSILAQFMGFWQKFLPYRRNFYTDISAKKFQTYHPIIISLYIAPIIDIPMGGPPSRRTPPLTTFRFCFISTRQDSWGGGGTIFPLFF